MCVKGPADSSTTLCISDSVTPVTKNPEKLSGIGTTGANEVDQGRQAVRDRQGLTPAQQQCGTHSHQHSH